MERSAAGPWSPALARPREWVLRVIDPEPADHDSAAAFAAMDDRALVEACREGRKRAFDVIVERHRRPIYQVCYRFVANHEDASDLSQEVFVRAWRGLDSFRGQAALSTWLYRIAVNLCLNRVAGRQLQTEPLAADAYVDERAPDPGSELMRAERAAAVRRAIAGLPDRQRATLILRVYQELSHREIAEILGSSVGAVKANFFHALANLKKNLGTEP